MEARLEEEEEEEYIYIEYSLILIDIPCLYFLFLLHGPQYRVKSLYLWNYYSRYQFKSPYLASQKFLVCCLLKMFSIISIHYLVKIHIIWIRQFCLGIYFGYSRYDHVHGHDLYWNGSNRSILLCICWQYIYQVGYGASP